MSLIGSPEDGDAPIYQGNPAVCTHSSQCPGDTRCGYPGFKRTKVEDGKVVPAYTCCPSNRVTTGQVCLEIPAGFRCETGKDVCANKACGHPGDKEKDVICCSSGKVYRFDGVSFGVGDTYCAENSNIGEVCVTSKGCKNGIGCGHPGSQEQGKVCCENGAFLAANGISYCRALPEGSVCPDGRGCKSGCCVGGVCVSEANCAFRRYETLIIIIIVFILILIIAYVVLKFL